MKRIVHLVSFAFSSGVRLLSLLSRKPDMVFVVQPTFFCAPMALLYGKLTGAKTVMHIQDYELDAMLGLGMGQGGKIVGLLERVERWFLRRFDVVSTISYSMLNLARSKGVDESKLQFFPNWADIDFVTPHTCGKAFKESIGLKPTDKVVLYAGNIGKKQGLEIVLDAAKSFALRTEVVFLFVGAGAHVDELRKLAKNFKLTNVHFLPLQEWADVPAMLAMADVHLVIQKKGAADAVLPSKLTNILAAGGNAIVTAERETELGQLVAKYPGIYELIEPEDANVLTRAIETVLSTKFSENYNKVARTYAEQHLDKNVIIQRFIEDISKLEKK